MAEVLRKRNELATKFECLSLKSAERETEEMGNILTRYLQVLKLQQVVSVVGHRDEVLASHDKFRRETLERVL